MSYFIQKKPFIQKNPIQPKTLTVFIFQTTYILFLLSLLIDSKMSNNPFHPSNQCLVGSTHLDLLVCEICNCHHSVSIIEPALPKIPWLTTLKCTNNNTHSQWSICQLCKTQRNQFTTV